jgi:hypothetical protein
LRLRGPVINQSHHSTLPFPPSSLRGERERAGEANQTPRIFIFSYVFSLLFFLTVIIIIITTTTSSPTSFYSFVSLYAFFFFSFHLFPLINGLV